MQVDGEEQLEEEVLLQAAGVASGWEKLDLDTAVLSFLHRLRLLATTTPAPAETDFNVSVNATIQWQPLIPIDDALILLAAVPSALLPIDFDLSIPSISPSVQSRGTLLDTLARLALEPACTLEVMHCFAPLAPHFWGRWLDMLGFDAELGDWAPREEASTHLEGEQQAVEKVFRAMVSLLSVFETVFPFLTTLLRHPLMGAPPLPPPTASQHELAIPLLTLHSLLTSMPYFPTSTHTMTSTALPWHIPSAVESILKSHPHRGIRLLAWRIVRQWLSLFGPSGEDLREKWVWKSDPVRGQLEGDFAPMPPYDTDFEAEYTQLLGPYNGEPKEADLVSSWRTELAGEARFVGGGVELAVRETAVDVWVLPALEAIKTREERAACLQNDADNGSLGSHEAKGSTYANLSSAELSPSVVDVEGLLVFREGFVPSTTYIALSSPKSESPGSHLAAAATQPSPDVFVKTPSTSALLRSAVHHLERRIPMLITSPPSSGKTSTLTHLWSILHSQPGSSQPTAQAKQRGLVFINLADRSLDSKSLLGSLSSAPATADTEAGTFAFVEGPLTRAVRQGRWVVLTSVDQASVEVLSVVKVLVERMHRAAETFVGAAWGGGGNEEAGGVGVRVGSRWVRAGRGFMLFATRSAEQPSEPVFFASHFFTDVWMDRPSKEEIRTIVVGRYERLGRAMLSEILIDVWEKAAAVVAREGSGGTARKIGVRDLMRWCRRVEDLLPRDVVITSIESNPTLQEEIFTEARDVFLGSLPVPVVDPSSSSPPRDRYSTVAKILGDGLGLSAERAEWVLRRRVPELVVPRVDEQDGKKSTATLKLHIGRVTVPYRPSARVASSRPYALTKPSLVVLEKLAVALRLSEPVLMVGETGTGKTAAVGHLADLLGKNLTALNLSTQTEAGDLIGGFRPIDEAEEAKRTAAQLVNRFIDLFGQTFSLSRNEEYVKQVRKSFEKKRWSRLVGLCREAFRMATERLGNAKPAAVNGSGAETPRKRRKVDSPQVSSLSTSWDDFLASVGDFNLRHVEKGGKSRFVFSFVEGPLAKAIRNGDWVLLDEVNLASAETLESLSTLLQAPDASLILTEQGDLEPIPRHPDFRLFACMNPATDVGKRDLPVGLRAKFSEIWVPPPDEDRDALVTVVQGYIGRVAVQDRAVILDVAELYSAVKALAIGSQLADGSNHPPHFSMRTLARALTFGAEFAPVFGLRRALFEGFLMAFTMLLDAKSSVVVKALLDQHIASKAKNSRSLFAQVPSQPTGHQSVRFGPYWLATGPEPLEEPKDYILTPSVQAKVLDLARAVLTRKVPVLIQGPTSAGKTSVVEYLAKRTGHRFVRINNHEHTDIQEYVGTYVSDPDSGKLVFQEGVLVRALRRGDWIVLDELNLAPTDVLEALNRLLDDNRELVIPETGEIVRPHPHFMLFATQNPPGLYGGRKVLSRAFRNRFLEMHFGDVPQDELAKILHLRCGIAPTYAEKTVAVFLELQRRRQAGRVFEQKHAFATLRDLFRWGGRGSVGYQQLAEDGYMLLAERARRGDDKAVVKDVIEQEMKVKIDDTTLYDFDRLAAAGLPVPPSEVDLVWTSAMRRLYYLIAAALLRDEPVLLVGETGSGKTSVCQSLAQALHRQLHVVGCHQNTETADLLGGQRPLRNRAGLQASARDEASALLSSPLPTDSDFDDVVLAVETAASAANDSRLGDLAERMRKLTALFEWHDGPLVQAMRAGDLILLDEISLADDSVLERLNSVLEPSRTLVLAEKGGRDLDDIRMIAGDGFQILATMNPGGDFGKKELSPALRNRFTEIWVPHVDDAADLLQIISSRWSHGSLDIYGPKILDFAAWFRSASGSTDGPGVGLRDILAWVDFLNAAFLARSESVKALDLGEVFYEGAMMTVVDGLGAHPATSGLPKESLVRLRVTCCQKLEALAEIPSDRSTSLEVVSAADRFFVGPFGVSVGHVAVSPSAEFTLLAPTTRLNAMRLLRALQLPKPVLLEGSPGVGKTSLVTALAAATGHHLVRINLSDQTDLMDLLGSDLPVEGGRSGEFAWKDAPFLAAMQQGSWVLLDEMNLASQSVLEGLNSSLDHRGTVYIPELDRTFVRHPDFRIFAAQNPLGQGGGRKGLPRSFLDRFSVVHMEELNSTDLHAIAIALYPDVDNAVLSKMITFNSTIHRLTMEDCSFGAEGSPWEFNLRDVLRWLSLLRNSSGLDERRGEPIEYVGLLYLQRFRTIRDRSKVASLFQDIFGEELFPDVRPFPCVAPRFLQVGHTLTIRNDVHVAGRPTTTAPIRLSSLQPFEALATCVHMGWLAILTGPKASGKSTLVRQLAAYGGCVLREFSMNAEVDTLELLGSFEQAERFRELDLVAAEALELLQEAFMRGTGCDSSLEFGESVTNVQQVREALAIATTDFDLSIASGVLVTAMEPLGDASVALVSRLHRLAEAQSTSARFEWTDGPLVRAMKAGEWLLIEDANLCSPSVLDRLNSLFEPGGRLQLAERGPVNGEIQIIAPHPDFRLVMTLDPRSGELSRAMRNRGIEIALLPPDLSHSTTALPTPSQYLRFSIDTFREGNFGPLQRLLDLLRVPGIDTDAAARVLVSSLSTAHQNLACRLLPSLRAFIDTGFDLTLRSIQPHSLTKHIDEAKRLDAHTREVPFSLLRLQSIDLSLTNARLTPLDESLARALDALAANLASRSQRIDTLRLVTARPKRLLTVWEKSALIAFGKLRLDDAEPAMVSLAPVSLALAVLVNSITKLDFSRVDGETGLVLAASAGSIKSLADELHYVSSAESVDFSSIQHVAAWIAGALHQMPTAFQGLANEAMKELSPLQSSIELRSGKAMTKLWRAFLPPRPQSTQLDHALRRLTEGMSAIVAWPTGLSDLFFDVAGSLITFSGDHSAGMVSKTVELVQNILMRVPDAMDGDKQTAQAHLEPTHSSNAASFLVAELSAIATTFGPITHKISSATLTRVVGEAAVAPLKGVLPLHQLLQQTGYGTSRAALEFGAVLAFCDRLALGPTSNSVASACDIVRPSLLHSVTTIRASESSQLGNVVILGQELHRSARLQALAASETQSRLESLRSVLSGAIAMTLSAAGGTTFDAVNIAGVAAQLTPLIAEPLESYLSSSLVDLTTSTPTLAILGDGFVGFARTLWHLYVPNLPLDPAVSLHARSAYLERQHASYTALIQAYTTLEMSSSGNSKNSKLGYLRADLDQIERQMNEAVGGVTVTRASDPVMLASLFSELRSFEGQVISDAHLDSLLGALRGPMRPETGSREINLEHSINTLLRRLDIAYETLSDIVAPIRLALCSLSIGFSLLLQSARCAALRPEAMQYGQLVAQLSSFPTAACVEAIGNADLPLSVKPGESTLAPSRATLLQLAALVKSASYNSSLSQEALFRTTQLYDRLHYLWSLDQRREEEEAQEAASLYRSKIDVQQVASDEELEAAEFALLFPSYDDVEQAESKSLPLDDKPLSSSPSRLLQPSDQASLSALHCSLFLPVVAHQGEPRQSFEAMRSSAIGILLPALRDGLDESIDRNSAPYRVRTLVDLSQGLVATSVARPDDRDFYTDADVRETARAVPILRALTARLEGLISLWPDQMVLQNLRERCETVLALSSKAPIAQVLTALEQLLSHTEDWESYASREHSLVIDRASLTDLIVSWRRMELTCWSRLLSTVQKRFGDSVSNWWFRFYEVTIRGAPGVDEDPDAPSTTAPAEYYRDLVSLLDEFLSTSSIGQFHARLELVQSFANFAARLSSNDKGMPGADSLCTVSRLMQNVHSFYEQFDTRIKAHLVTERARIEKDVQSLIKLASWKDVNVYALRQSAIRSHHQLYKNVRKLRVVLQKPASDFFTMSPLDYALAPSETLPLREFATAEIPEMPVAVRSSTAAAHHERLAQTLHRLTALSSSQLQPHLSQDYATSLDDLAVQIISTSKALRDEPLGPEEGREQRGKSLVTRKRRAWIELLRELKRIGISPTPSPNTISRLRDSGVAYGLVSSTEVLQLSDAVLGEQRRRQLIRADDYHFRLLSELPQIRTTPAAHHADVSTREVQRALGSVESCISFGFTNRPALIDAVASQVDVSAVLARMEHLATSNRSQLSRPAKEATSRLFTMNAHLLDALRETLLGLDRHHLALGNEDVSPDDERALLRDAEATLVKDQHQLASLNAEYPLSDPILATDEELDTLDAVHEHISTIVRQFVSLEWTSETRYLGRPFIAFLAGLEVPAMRFTTASPLRTHDLEHLSTAHERLIDSILVIAQELQKMEQPANDPDADELGDLSVKITLRSLQGVLATLRLPDVLRQLRSFVKAAHTAMRSTAFATDSVKLVLRAAPFVREYATLVDQHLACFLDWHKASLKVAHVLASILKELAADGFCRPSDDDGAGETDAGGQTSDGTGMADGKGAKNVSDEIEDESQVEGMQGDVEKQEEEQKEEGDDDDAIEMSMDFEGEMEDRGDGDKEKDDDDDDDSDTESQADPEEQIADVDPLDPSSVDEKFWGDDKPPQDENANEEVNQEASKSAGESEMTAKDDEAPAPQPKKDGDEGAAKPEDGEKPEKDAEGDKVTDGDEELAGEDGDSGDEGQDGEEQDDDDDGAPQADDGERLDQQMPEADNLDLPDDLQLDGEEKKDDEDLDLGSDDGSMPDVDGNDEQGGEPEANSDDEPLNEQDGDDPSLADQLQPDPSIPQEDVPSLDQSSGGADHGDNGGEGGEDTTASAQPREAPTVAETAPSPSKAADSQPTGDEEEENVDAPDGRDDEAEMPDANHNEATNASSTGADNSKQRTQASDPTSKARSEKPAPVQPERSLGDALQSWQRRLEAIADMQDPDSTKTDLDPSAPGPEDAVEFVPEGEQKEQDGQALGPATEDQVQGLEQLRLGEEEDNSATFEPDLETMDVDEHDADKPMPVASSTVEVGGSSLAESTSKAVPASELRNQESHGEDDMVDVDLERSDDVADPSTTLVDPIEDAAVEEAMLQWRTGEDEALTADGVWRLYETLTRDLSFALTEQLRLILEPTLATRLKGDYRSGKRLNMKKIIPYIASEFTKDKIWLRRTRPSQREYQVLIAIDDSKSMADSHSVHLAYQSLALITRALTRLEVGGVSICRFGDNMDVLHPFEGGPVSEEAGATLLGKFTFAQRTTDVRLLVEKSLAHLALAKATAKSSVAADDLWQLQIIISDGMCQDHDKLRALLRRGAEQKVMFVFIVIDSLHRRTTDGDPLAASDVNQNSILAMKSVSYTKGASGQLELKMDRYLDSFPFEYFVVLRDVEALPEVLSATLRQFFEGVSSDR